MEEDLGQRKENSLEKIENTKTGSRNELGLFERVKKKG